MEKKFNSFIIADGFSGIDSSGIPICDARDVSHSSDDRQGGNTYKGRMIVAAAEGVIFSAVAFTFPLAAAGATVCFSFAAYNGLKLKSL